MNQFAQQQTDSAGMAARRAIISLAELGHQNYSSGGYHTLMAENTVCLCVSTLVRQKGVKPEAGRVRPEILAPGMERRVRNH